MRFCHAILFATVLFSLRAMAQDSPKTPGEKKAISVIAHLPEVVANNNYSLKKYKLPLVIEVDSKPTKGRANYNISVYQERPDICMMNNRYHFEVDAKTYAVRVWDIAADTTWSLKAWRRHVKAINKKRLNTTH